MVPLKNISCIVQFTNDYMSIDQEAHNIYSCMEKSRGFGAQDRGKAPWKMSVCPSRRSLSIKKFVHQVYFSRLLAQRKSHVLLYQSASINHVQPIMERERENSVFVYRNKQAGAKTWWVRYIVVNYWLHPSFGGVG